MASTDNSDDSPADSPAETPTRPDGTGPSGPAGGHTPIAPSQLRWLMGGLMIGLFLSSAEQSIVATALPTMAGELGSANQISWVVSSYLLTSTISTPLYGKMSDLYGRKSVYQTSILVFLVGSVLCGVAPGMSTLIAARAVQGLGGGGLMSLAFVIIGDVVSPRERGKWIGLFTAIFTTSAILGPLIGGLLVDGPGWRWVFFVVVPIAALALAVTNRGLRLPFATRAAIIDRAGIALLVIGSTALILVPVWGGDAFAWRSLPVIAAAVVAVAAIVAFVAVERRAPEPVVPMRLFADRTSSVIFGLGFLLMGSMVAVVTFLPLFLQISTGVSATRSGLMLIPQSIGINVFATGAGFLTSRYGRYKWGLVLGPLLATAALVWMTTIDVDTDVVQLAPILFLFGGGLGLVFPNLTLTIQNSAPFADMGIATSTSNFFRSMGAAFGAAAGGAILAGRLDEELIARLGPARVDELGGADELIRSPDRVRELDADLQVAAAESVAEAVIAIIWRVAPIMAAMAVLALAVRETALRTESAIGGADRSEGDA